MDTKQQMLVKYNSPSIIQSYVTYYRTVVTYLLGRVKKS